LATHKKQHWIPQSYLGPWCDPDVLCGHEPYVWRFDKDGSEGHPKAPKNIFAETNFYTVQLPDGTRDLTLEHGLAGLESDFCRIRDTAIAGRDPLSSDDRTVLCIFVAAMHARTRAQRDH